MMRFTGTVTPIRREGEHHDVFVHPEVTDEGFQAWEGGYPDSYLYDEDNIERVEDIRLSGVPDDKRAGVAVYRTHDGTDRVWAEATGHIVDTFVGVYDDIETLWMRIETLDFSEAL